VPKKCPNLPDVGYNGSEMPFDIHIYIAYIMPYLHIHIAN